MMSGYIQGWRVGITDHPGRRELEIQGPGELHIVIRKFKTSNFYHIGNKLKLHPSFQGYFSSWLKEEIFRPSLMIWKRSNNQFDLRFT